jgi:hypothetical protein
VATWKYGPIETYDDANGYCEPIKEVYEVTYSTSADILTILRDGKVYSQLGYDASRAVGSMIAKWYLGYVLNKQEIISEIEELETK